MCQYIKYQLRNKQLEYVHIFYINQKKINDRHIIYYNTKYEYIVFFYTFLLCLWPTHVYFRTNVYLVSHTQYSGLSLGLPLVSNKYKYKWPKIVVQFKVCVSII